MTTRREVLEGLRASIVAVTGLSAGGLVRMAYQNAPRGREPGVVIRAMGDRGVGRAAEGGGVYRQSRRLRVQLDAIGESAVVALTDWHALATSGAPVLSSVLQAADVAVQSVGEVVDRTEVRTSGYEPRASFDLVAGYVWTRTEAGPAAADRIVATVETLEASEDGPQTVFDEAANP